MKRNWSPTTDILTSGKMSPQCSVIIGELNRATNTVSNRVGKDMADETVEALARQLIRRLGRSQAMQICQTNKWFRVLDHIKSVDKGLNTK